VASVTLDPRRAIVPIDRHKSGETRIFRETRGAVDCAAEPFLPTPFYLSPTDRMSSRTLILTLAAAFAAAPLAAQHPVAAGEIVAGTLDDNDPQMEDGAYYEAYVLRGRPGEALLVRMRSQDFDTYLHWGRGSGDDWDEEAANDDAGDGTDSRLVVRLDGSGEYQLRAAGFDADAVGEYSVWVTAVNGEVHASPLRVGQTVQGELSDGDYESENGVEDHYVVQGAPGAQITVYAESDDFDTYLEFGTWAGGVLDAIAEDDDGAEGTNSEMVAEFGDGGEHHVVVRSFSGDETGAYTLRVVQGAVQDEWDDDGDGDDEWVETDTIVTTTTYTDTLTGGDFSGMGYTIVPVRAGESVEDALDEDDPQDEDGGYYQQFTYQARAGERLTITVSSDEMDSYVMVGTGMYDDFQALAEDDDSGGDLDAELGWTAPESGEYTIQVSTAVPGQTGPFVLRVRSGR
jgi:3'-phosphoadenosine 5'-phosphosulfate sulfotransferase